MSDIRDPQVFLGQDSQQPDALAVLMEEYRAMYALVLYRLSALDQRIPIATAAITTVFGSIAVLPQTLQIVLLIAVPLSLVWLVATTTNHARSLEDAFRRIEVIEQSANAAARSQVMTFQSTHPSRGKRVGGRTGQHTVDAVSATALLLIAGCYALAVQLVQSIWHTAYCVYVAITLAVMWRIVRSVRRYAYVTSQAMPSAQ
jgi:hypothetical protein